jgi:response regulator NasT
MTRSAGSVICAAQTGQELVRFCQETRPDLVVADIKMPDLDGIDAIREIGRNEPIPAILVSAYHDPELIERIKTEQVLAYLVKPIKQADLEVVIGLAMQRFDQFQTLRKEAGELRQALADRKVIERAKGILMKRAGLDEDVAFRRLIKLARDHNRRIVDAAQVILQAEEALQPPE